MKLRMNTVTCRGRKMLSEPLGRNYTVHFRVRFIIHWMHFLRAARDREIDSNNSKLAAHFNDELIRSCDYFLVYCGDALPDQHRKALGDATKLLKGTLEEDIPKLIPEISVTLDPALGWSDDSYSPG
jgi:hypothetical protein